MTFKHVKFEDSPTMRALEKVAKEKGLVKPETLQKKASAPKKIDLSPSSNLMENIFKLCNGLREKGLEKEASELETSYLNYKKAQTLYEAHKEKGEDLIHAAHPDGSHKLENVEGDEAVFEDILDQHLKHVQMIEKKPTGKLSNASKVIKAVKLALGQEEQEEEQDDFAEEKKHAANAKPLAKKAVTYFNNICNSLVQNVKDEWMWVPFYQASNWGMAHASTHINALRDVVQSALNDFLSSPSVTPLENIKKYMLVLRDSVIDNYSSDDLSGSKKGTYKQYVNTAISRIEDAKTALTTGDLPEGTVDATKPKGQRQGVTVIMNNESKQFIFGANALLREMSGWPAAIDSDTETTPAEKNSAKAWITDKMNYLTQMRDQFIHIQDPNEQNNKATEYLQNLNNWKNTVKYDKFKSTWV